jgi:glycosyltransferase involved in cell wall biosynthesis
MSVYNGQQYLRQSVESILTQTFRDFEFIIVNDGSSDESREILSEYAGSDSRIRLINQENTGLTVALIRGCAVARAPYIARQDCDDWSHPERLEKCLAEITRGDDLVMVSSATHVIDSAGDVVFKNERIVNPETATHDLLYRRIGPPGHGSVMFRRNEYTAVGGYRRCFYYAQDVDLWLRLAQVGLLVYVPEYLYAYRIEPASISGQHSDRQMVFGELCRECLDARMADRSEVPFLQQAESLRAEIESEKGAVNGLRRQRAGAHYRIGTGMSRLGNPRARDYFWATVRLNPLHWRGWCRLGWEYARLICQNSVRTKSN